MNEYSNNTMGVVTPIFGTSFILDKIVLPWSLVWESSTWDVGYLSWRIMAFGAL